MMKTNPFTPTTAGYDVDLTDELSAVLTSSRRRHVLSVLATGANHASFDSLVDAVVDYERHRQADEEPAVSESDVAATLHHCHLPKLAEAGVIGTDYAEEGVELTDAGVECATVLGLRSIDL